MKHLILILFIFFYSYNSWSITIPKDGKATFDFIRKNKNIGSITSIFTEEDNKLKIHTIVDIKVKVLFIPAYKFFQETTEIWKDNELIEIVGFTDFEDEREYHIKGKDKEDNFIASGMDGELILDKSIITLNYWNKNTLNQKEVFDTQKGIVREISVNKLENEIININDLKLDSEKYTLNASKNPKDLNPFPEYTLWYYKDELIKFLFKNPKDKKIVTAIRSNWNNN
ncbi:MAG: hypothetical protein CFH15_01494 [Alphaproteobacteria bacterium MarineAlpha5_Bin5]|nr:MAG: hypothetical protein CFH15_01494 [Alphaproteobacteria bacterium MarineAlpha5_Bin5]PPR51794.1 MAG: hypothetical protein CFH14_00617 [Alphaproteobacteria bacterium MarineAlpha5_Bin4]|tara:strand:- start:2351 stop:3031 length:681 start_codon:yes stop_codon:yes gene_type:complete